MSARPLDKPRLLALRGEVLARWLQRTGWTRELEVPGRFTQYVKHREPRAADGEPEVVDVLHRVTPDYAACMRTALATLSLVEGRPAEVILDDIEAQEASKPIETLARLRERLVQREGCDEAIAIVDRMPWLLAGDVSTAASAARHVIDLVSRAVVGVHADEDVSTAALLVDALRGTDALPDAMHDAPPSLATLVRAAHTWLDDFERLVSRAKAPETPDRELGTRRLVEAMARGVEVLLRVDASRSGHRDVSGKVDPGLVAAFERALDERVAPMRFGEDDEAPTFLASDVLRVLDPELYREQLLEFLSARPRSEAPDAHEDEAGGAP